MDRAEFPLTTTRYDYELEKTTCRSSVSCVSFPEISTLFCGKSTQVPCCRAYIRFLYSEPLDLEILSAASSIPRPLNIQCSVFDPIFLRFCTLLRRIYACIHTYYLPCVLDAAGSIRSSCYSELFCDILCTYAYVLLTVRPILRFCGVTLDKSAYEKLHGVRVSKKYTNGLRIHVFTKYIPRVIC